MNRDQYDQSPYQNMNDGTNQGTFPSPGYPQTQTAFGDTNPFSEPQAVPFQIGQTAKATFGLEGASVVDMVWFSFLTAFYFALFCIKDEGSMLIFLSVFAIRFFFGWIGYKTSNKGSRLDKLSYFKCYKIFRMIEMGFFFIVGAVFMVLSLKDLLENRNSFREIHWGLVHLLLSCIVLAGPSFTYCTNKGLEADLRALESELST